MIIRIGRFNRNGYRPIVIRNPDGGAGRMVRIGRGAFRIVRTYPMGPDGSQTTVSAVMSGRAARRAAAAVIIGHGGLTNAV